MLQFVLYPCVVCFVINIIVKGKRLVKGKDACLMHICDSDIQTTHNLQDT